MRNLHRMDEFHLDEGTRQLILSTRHAVPDLRKHIEDAKCIIERFNMFYRNGEEKAEILEGLGQRFPELIVTSSLFQNLEINGPGANKGNALTWLCEYLGMTSEQAMVIGDNLNDLSAIQCAGLGIAMGNAIDEVKVIADAVTGNNNEAGVADAIYRYLLK